MLLIALALFAWRLHRIERLRPWALAAGGAALGSWQADLSNVVLGWPLLAAVAHTAGAAAWVIWLTLRHCRHCGAPARAAPSLAGSVKCAFSHDDRHHHLDRAGGTSLPSRWRQFYALTKPRVVQLIVFCAVIGMLLATPGVPDLAASRWRPPLGIWLVAAAAAAFNCIVEQRIDARMPAPPGAPPPSGELTNTQTLSCSRPSCCAPRAAALLYFAVNPLTMWLTFATFVGYAVIYTVMLKPMTPQNIVIGGASGAMPPVLGWAAIRGDVGYEALIMCLIIFLWTPPHFWALALYRAEDYRKSGLPMLPVTHGAEFTRLHVFLYTLVLFAGTLLPFVSGMSGVIYLIAAVLLNAGFVGYAWKLWRSYSDQLARKTFRYSIIYLSLLFAALLVDHYLRPWL